MPFLLSHALLLVLPMLLASGLAQEEPTCQVWKQLGGDIDGEEVGDRFGFSMQLSQDGTILAVGGINHDGPRGSDTGQVRAFYWNATNNKWNQLGSTLYGQRAGDNLARLSLSGDGKVLATGARRHDVNGKEDAGHAKVFRFDAESDDWLPLGQEFKGTSRQDYLGNFVALNLDGSVLGVAAYEYDGASNGTVQIDSGLVQIYSYNNNEGVWEPKGQDLLGENAGDKLGAGIRFSADGSIVAVSASFHDGINGADSGQALVYKYNDSSDQWDQLGQVIDGEGAGDESGFSVALSADGTILAVSAISNDGANGADSGHVRVFKFNDASNLWNQLGEDIDGEDAGDQSGWSVSLSADGRILAVGAFTNSGVTGRNSGHARVFKYANDSVGSSWMQIGDDIDGEDGGDRSGSGVYLSGDGSIVAIKADFNQARGRETGHARVFMVEDINCMKPPAPISDEQRKMPVVTAIGIALAVLFALTAGLVFGRKLWNKDDNVDTSQLPAAVAVVGAAVTEENAEENVVVVVEVLPPLPANSVAAAQPQDWQPAQGPRRDVQTRGVEALDAGPDFKDQMRRSASEGHTKGEALSHAGPEAKDQARSAEQVQGRGGEASGTGPDYKDQVRPAVAHI